jgi:hypothetical protein
MCYNKNWTKSIDDLEDFSNQGKLRKLTIFGKVSIVNSLAVSILIYIGSISKFPNKEMFTKLQSLLYNFIMNKRDRIKRNTQVGNVREGGVGIIDISLKLKYVRISWINKILSKKSSLLFCR